MEVYMWDTRVSATSFMTRIESSGLVEQVGQSSLLPLKRFNFKMELTVERFNFWKGYYPLAETLCQISQRDHLWFI